MILPMEDAAEFNELAEGLRAELKPVGPLEALLTDKIKGNVWRRARVCRMEAALFAWELLGLELKCPEEEAQGFRRIETVALPDEDRILVEMTRTIETTKVVITDEEKYAPILDRAGQIRKKREEYGAHSLMLVSDRGNDRLGNSSRCEAAIERRLFRTLRELRFTQDRRTHGTAPLVTQTVEGIDSEREG